MLFELAMTNAGETHVDDEFTVAGEFDDVPIVR